MGCRVGKDALGIRKNLLHFQGKERFRPSSSPYLVTTPNTGSRLLYETHTKFCNLL